MTRLMGWMRHLGQFTCTLLTLLGDGVYYFRLRLRSRAALAAEDLFLRKQLALYRERSITPRRECLDLMIPLTEGHLRRILYEWGCHDHAGRPPMALGPGIPQPPVLLPVPLQVQRHRLPEPLQVVAHPILGGLHHEYQRIEKAV